MTLIKSISGIRGTIGGKPGDALTPVDIIKFSSAYGAWLQVRNPGVRCAVVIGRDARISGEMVSGLVVSNHGGRNLDGGISALVQLPFIRRAVGENALLLVDGGITRGSDIVKALSLGANAIMIGRPYIWGLSCFGAAGVQRVIEILQSELETTMILCGMSSIGEIDSDLTWTG